MTNDDNSRSFGAKCFQSSIRVWKGKLEIASSKHNEKILELLQHIRYNVTARYSKRFALPKVILLHEVAVENPIRVRSRIQ